MSDSGRKSAAQILSGASHCNQLKAADKMDSIVEALWVAMVEALWTSLDSMDTNSLLPLEVLLLPQWQEEEEEEASVSILEGKHQNTLKHRKLNTNFCTFTNITFTVFARFDIRWHKGDNITFPVFALMRVV